MSELKQSLISAQVILVGRNQNKIGGQTDITSDNISDYSPNENTISELNKIFSDKGFEVGGMVGISISVTAPREVFEEFLEVKIYKEKDGSFGFVSKGKKLGRELKNKFLPGIIKDKVLTITFTKPPDFGPANW
jgi:hypothetical protein